MNIRKYTLLGCATFLASVTTASAAIRLNLPIPPPSGFIDTESSVTLPFAGWRDDTRRFEIQFELRTTNEAVCVMETCCVQIAFGTDANGDEDLEPEETDLIVGIDCGESFVREEGLGLRSTEENVASPFSTFDLSRIFDRNWNRVKVTTRNLPTNVVASIVATFRNNPTLIILR